MLTYVQMRQAVPRLRFDLDRIQAMSEGERAEFEAFLRRWRDTRERNPLTGYLPAGPKHFAFHTSEARTRVFAGGNRAGKTTTAVVDDLIQMTPDELIPDHLRQFKRHTCPFYCRLMAPDMKRTMIPVIHQKLKEWTPKDLFRGGTFEQAYSRTDECLRLECGCRFDFLSYEMDLDKFGGAALHRCHYDEEPPEDIRSECRYRLVDYEGDELFSFTPLKGLSWSYKHLWKRRGEMTPDGKPRIWADSIGMADNEHIARSEIEEMRAEIRNEAELRQRLYGEFAERGGPVYSNIMDRVQRELTQERVLELLPRMDAIIVGIDPGVRWAGFSWTAFDRDNYAVTFEAQKVVGAHVGDYADLLRKMEARWRLDRLPRKPMYVIDPAARTRDLISATTFQSELSALGFMAVPGQNDKEAGVSNIQRRLHDGSLTIAPWCTELLDEGIEYAYEERQDEKFSVVDRNNHVLDSWRYALMARPWGSAARETRIKTGPDRVPRPPRRSAEPGYVSVMGPMV